MKDTYPVSNKKLEEHGVDAEAHNVRFKAIEDDYEAQIEVEKTRAGRVEAEIEARSLNRYNDACGKITTEQTRAELVETGLSERITSEVKFLTSVDETIRTEFNAHIDSDEIHITRGELYSLIGALDWYESIPIVKHTNEVASGFIWSDEYTEYPIGSSSYSFLKVSAPIPRENLSDLFNDFAGYPSSEEHNYFRIITTDRRGKVIINGSNLVVILRRYSSGDYVMIPIGGCLSEANIRSTFEIELTINDEMYVPSLKTSKVNTVINRAEPYQLTFVPYKLLDL